MNHSAGQLRLEAACEASGALRKAIAKREAGAFCVAFVWIGILGFFIVICDWDSLGLLLLLLLFLFGAFKFIIAFEM